VKDFTEAYKAIIMPIITKHLPNAKIILYGSRARGDFRRGSDIDVALDMGHTIDTLIMSNILGDLEESKLPINFDIVDFWRMSEDMQKEILKDGILWK
jgi:predicted nucleotidyltransferase